MDYQDQLSQPEWKAKRKEILERDTLRCTKCNSKKRLEVHHTKYPEYGKMAWEVPNNWLRTLCANCHRKTHSKKKPRKQPKANTIGRKFKLFCAFLSKKDKPKFEADLLELMRKYKEHFPWE